MRVWPKNTILITIQNSQPSAFVTQYCWYLFTNFKCV